jgi:hypothetical protein
MAEWDPKKTEARKFAEAFGLLPTPSGLTTYCGKLAHFLPKEVESFKKEESHYTIDGVRAIYRCDIDGRLYTVDIRAVG